MERLPPEPSATPPTPRAGAVGRVRAVHELVRFPRNPHGPSASLRASGIVLGYVAIAYWLTGWLLPRLLRTAPDLNFYVAQPVVWSGLAVLAYAMWRRLEDMPRFSKTLTVIAFAVGVFHVGLLVIAGILFGFGDSPIAGRLVNYPKNGLYIVTLLLGVETARGFLYETWRRSHEALAFAGAALVFFVVSVPAAQWTTFDEAGQFARVVGGRWVPALALSILATWLVRLGGIGPSFGYRIALFAFEWFSPVLPNLEWLMLLIVGVAAPLIGAELIRSISLDTAEGETRFAELEGWADDEADDEPRETSWWGIGVTAAGLLVIVLFFTGGFGVKPFTVTGISMEPAYVEGDVVVVRTGVDAAALEVGDVIRFRDGPIPTVHRIVAIEQTGDGRVFTTRGDNVRSPDAPIAADVIEGKVVFRIPQIGKLKLWLSG